MHAKILIFQQKSSMRMRIFFLNSSFLLTVSHRILWIIPCQNTSVVFTIFTGRNITYLPCIKIKSVADKEELLNVKLIYMSKTFNCLSHELLLEKNCDNGFSIATLTLIRSYLTKKTENKDVFSYSHWKKFCFDYHKFLL